MFIVAYVVAVVVIIFLTHRRLRLMAALRPLVRDDDVQTRMYKMAGFDKPERYRKFAEEESDRVYDGRRLSAYLFAIGYVVLAGLATANSFAPFLGSLSDPLFQIALTTMINFLLFCGTVVLIVIVSSLSGDIKFEQRKAANRQEDERIHRATNPT